MSGPQGNDGLFAAGAVALKARMVLFVERWPAWAPPRLSQVREALLTSRGDYIAQVDWIDASRLQGFILRCQDAEDGGIAERPGNLADIFHTFFGIAGLSLLGYFENRYATHHTHPLSGMRAEIRRSDRMECSACSQLSGKPQAGSRQEL